MAGNQEELKVVITSQVDDGVKGLIAFDKAAEDLVKITKQLTAQFTGLSSSIPKFDNAVKSSATSTKNLNTNLTAVSKSGTNTFQVFNGLNNTIRDLPFGFIAIQNNLTQISDGLLGSATAGLAVGFALSIAVTAITTAVQKYGSLGNAVNQVFNLETAAEKQQRAYNTVIDEASKNVSGQVAQLELLRSKLIDLSIPQTDRAKALVEYNKIADDNNKISKQDINNISRINQLITEQIKLFGERAIAAAAEKELSKEAEKFFAVQRKTAPILNQTSKFLTDQADAAADAVKGIKNLRLATEEEAAADSGLQKNITNQLKQLANIQNTQAYKDAQKELQEATNNFNAALGEIEPFTSIEGLTDKITKPVKNIKTISDILKELSKDLLGLDAAFAATGGSLRDLSEDKIRAISGALKELSTLGVLPGSDLFSQLQQQIAALQSTLVRTPITFKIPIKIEALPDLTSNAQTIQRVMDGVKDTFRAQLDPFTNEVNEIIRSATQNGISSLAEGIGNALISGNISDVVSGFVNAISGFLSNLGKLLIVQGIALQAFTTSLKSLNGITAVIAGGALVVAAAAFKALAGNGIPSFATSGTVFGPTLAMIGDNPGREEHVISSEVLDKLGGGWGLPDKIELFLSGTNAVRVLQRGQTGINRVNG